MLDVVDTPYRGRVFIVFIYLFIYCIFYCIYLLYLGYLLVGHYAPPQYGVSTASSIIPRLCMAYPPQ